MSKWRKHVTQASDHLEPPGEGQQIAQAVGSRGSNLIEVRLPDGQQTLCVLPAKFNKKLWVKRGGYLVVEHGGVDASESVTGTILSVLYEKDIRYLRSLPGVWPEAFAQEVKAGKAEEAPVSLNVEEGLKLKELEDALPAANGAPGDATAATANADGSEYSSSEDDGLPPLEPNKNRPIREYTYSDDESSSEEGQ